MFRQTARNRITAKHKIEEVEHQIVRLGMDNHKLSVAATKVLSRGHLRADSTPS